MQTITASAGTGGTISPQGNVSIPYGSNRTFTLTPNAEYLISAITVNGNLLGAAANYTFSNVTTDQTIAAAFAPTPFLAWKQTQFGSEATNPLVAADLADPDADGIVNLIEWAIGGVPTASTVVAQSIVKQASNLEFTYPVNKSANNLNRSVEWSDNLRNGWNSAGVTVPVLVPGSDDGLTQLMKVILPAGSGARFVRLKVMRP